MEKHSRKGGGQGRRQYKAFAGAVMPQRTKAAPLMEGSGRVCKG
ncbi:hypothetical protein PY793_03930 [Acetobacter fabarum]